MPLMSSLPSPTVNVPKAPNAPPTRTLVPIPRPLVVQPPVLTLPLRDGPFCSEWTRSTHIIPAVVPRNTPDVPCPSIEFGSDSRADGVKVATKYLEDVRSVQLLRPAPEHERSRKQLYIAVNWYKNATSRHAAGRKPLTLLFTHACGFHKEIWEPTLSALVKQLEVDGSLRVEDIWTWESVNHGDSALLNAPNLGGIYDWQDNARDILNFLLHYMPPSSCLNTSLHLPLVPKEISQQRQREGFVDRTFVVVGHSFGGASAVLAASHSPRLFDSLILIDPVIESVPTELRSPLPGGAVRRRTRWSSREHARASLLSNPFFASWHPDVLSTFVESGLTPSPGGGVQLKTPSIQEAATFADVWSSNDAFESLPELDERIELRWIMPDLKKSWARHDAAGELAQRRVWRRQANASNVVMSGVGHLIPQESPRELAVEIHGFLSRKYGQPANLPSMSKL